MDWGDLAGWSLDALGGFSPSAEEEPRESPNVVICGWMGAFAGAAAGAALALALLPPLPPAGTFDLSMDGFTRQRIWGLIIGLFGGLLLGAFLGRQAARLIWR